MEKKRYLVVFISEGEFCCQVVMADTLLGASLAFDYTGINYDEIYSITRSPFRIQLL